MKKNVSLKDIAAELGVSPSLVSYVLNGHAKKKRVADDVAQRVIATAKKLHYHPNQIAKSLKTNKTHTIGLIVADIHYRFTTGVTRAIEAAAKKNNYTVFIGNTHEDLQTLSELIQALIQRQVDGLIIAAVENSEQIIKYLKGREVPFVLIDRNFPKVKTNFIGIDNYRVAYKATDYLIRRRFKCIAFINYQTSFFHLHERDRGYLQALKDGGVEPDPGLHKKIRKSHYSDDVKNAIAELVSHSSSCDAIFFATDTLAITGLKNIIDLKVRVPGDMAVISFDESETFGLFECPVTHFKQPLEEMGIAAVDLLFDVMKEGKRKQILLESKLVVGKSCGE
ncbi:MAG: LacI family transcriptional regulator [Bacteroidota bacterium]|nr:LacI family transcriptional regulator [Bacteroidota bacterium]